MEKWHLIQEDDHLIFIKDIEFGSPCAAGSF